MGLAYHTATVTSVLLFLGYGLVVLFADGMVEEFERFGLSRFRRLTGTLEVLGAIGLAVGYLLPWVAVLSATGLAVLMLLGVGVRVRVRDSILETLPAVVLLVLNAWIAVRATELL